MEKKSGWRWRSCTLEEGKVLWVWGLLGRDVVVQILNGDVAMTDNVAVRTQFLRCGIVGGQGIGEGTGVQVGQLNLVKLSR